MRGSIVTILVFLVTCGLGTAADYIRIDADSLQELSFADAINWAAGYRSDAVDTFMGSLTNGRADL